MTEIEDLMRKELEDIELRIKANQKEYRDLRKAYDKKRRAMSQWSRPTVPTRAPKPTPVVTKEEEST